MNHRNQVAKYILSDILSAIFVWIIFFLFRKLYFESILFCEVISNSFQSEKLYIGIIFVPVFWIFVYYLTGYYSYIMRKNHFEDFGQTFKAVIIGVVVLFFVLLLDDEVLNYHNYYIAGSVLLGLQFFATLIPRMLITGKTQRDIESGKIKFNTLVIGCGDQALDIYNELLNKKPTYGNKFVGFVHTSSDKNCKLPSDLPLLGTIENLPDLVSKYEIEELIIAINSKDKEDINEVLSWLGYSEIIVKAIAGLYHDIRGKKKITNILGTPLLEIEHELMPLWQQAVKSIIDIIISLLAIILLSPFYIICAIGIIITSKGPILFVQERIGKNGKPFLLYKFRSMYIDAEKFGPNLAKENDNRCTPFGKFLRQTKLDEIPNFFNVLNGDMALVGPRPERQFYIEQIVKIAPKYKQLQKLKPGITSLGQVRFGYASDVEQMTKRLRYDVLYMQNMSLYTDFIIIYYTIVLLFKGRHV